MSKLKNNDLIADITVDPVLNTYELTDLKCGAAYEVQISAFTQTGEGVRSKASLVTTNQCQGYTKKPIINKMKFIIYAPNSKERRILYF